MTTEFERAFYASDAAYDQRFVTAVRTTGIYCRPSCRVRKPLMKNVTFMADAAAARAAGYRACLRCHPDEAARVTVRTVSTPIGRMTLGVTATAVVLADFTERPRMPAQLAGIRRRIGPMAEGSSALLDDTERQLTEYFDGARRDFDLPIDAPGSPFQERVWGELRRIPYGETVSYRELGERVEAAPAWRAVGRANGSNRLAVIIPCHRVIATGGGLGGYGGGLAAKRLLLDLESGGSSGGSLSADVTGVPTNRPARAVPSLR